MSSLLNKLIKYAVNVASPIGSMINNFRALKSKNNYYSEFFNGEESIDESSDWAGNLIKGNTGSGLTAAQKEANYFNSAEAEKQRIFERDMSNTTYQRTVADMQAAGLNPAVMLAGGASGVSTPSGSSASSVSPAVGSIGDLLSLVRMPFELANLQADTDKINKETNDEIPARIQQMLSTIDVNKNNARNLGLEGDKSEIVLKYLDKQQDFYTASLSLSNEKISQEVKESVARVENLSHQNMKILQEIAESQQRVSLLLAEEKLTLAQRDEVFHLIEKIDAEKKNIEKYTELTQKDIDWYTANHVVNMASSAIGSVGSLVGGLGKAFGSAAGSLAGSFVKNRHGFNGYY